jgi:hypothetical protein
MALWYRTDSLESRAVSSTSGFGFSICTRLCGVGTRETLITLSDTVLCTHTIAGITADTSTQLPFVYTSRLTSRIGANLMRARKSPCTTYLAAPAGFCRQAGSSAGVEACLPTLGLGAGGAGKHLPVRVRERKHNMRGQIPPRYGWGEVTFPPRYLPSNFTVHQIDDKLTRYKNQDDNAPTKSIDLQEERLSRSLLLKKTGCAAPNMMVGYEREFSTCRSCYPLI